MIPPRLVVFFALPGLDANGAGQKIGAGREWQAGGLKLGVDIKADAPSKASTGTPAVDFSQTLPEARDPVDRRREREVMALSPSGGVADCRRLSGASKPSWQTTFESRRKNPA
jgi:hypothetical protein